MVSGVDKHFIHKGIKISEFNLIVTENMVKASTGCRRYRYAQLVPRTTSSIYYVSRKLFNLYFVHNSGGAWGILAGYTWLLLSITAVIMIIGVTVLICKGTKNKWLFWAVSLILSGGLGNMYDRIFNGGRVIDFIQFDFWQSFPIFNIADCAIVIGCAVLILYFILDAVKPSEKEEKAE